MQDSELIWRFLVREYKDDDVVIYLAIKGGERSTQNAIDRITKITDVIFYPSIHKTYILKVIKSFLEMKKKQYINGEIRINTNPFHK